MNKCEWCKSPIGTGHPICTGIVRWKEKLEPSGEIKYYHHGDCCTEADNAKDKL